MRQKLAEQRRKNTGAFTSYAATSELRTNSVTVKKQHKEGTGASTYHAAASALPTKRAAAKTATVLDKKQEAVKPEQEAAKQKAEEDENPYGFCELRCYPEDTYEMTDTEELEFNSDGHNGDKEEAPTSARASKRTELAL